MIGIRFKIKNEYNTFLSQIFHSVEVQRYEWEIVTDDVICSSKPNLNEGLFGSEIVNGQTFLNSIIIENYYMIFVDLKAYPQGSVHTNIEVFGDFYASDCQIILLCVDSEFIEFYCKDKSILDIVHNNCLKFGFEDVELIPLEKASNSSMIAF
jgi:hypothetical protein